MASQFLSNKFTCSGLSKETEEELDEVWQEWKSVRQSWMEKQIVKTIAQNIISKDQAEVLSKGGSLDECAFTSVATAMTVQNCISGLKSKNIVGLDADDLRHKLPKNEDLQHESTILRSEVQKKIIDDCKEMYLFMNHLDEFGNDPPALVAAKTLQVGSSVQEKVSDLKEKKKLIDTSIKAKNEMLKNYVKTLIENAKVMRRILDKYKIQLATERDQIICKSLVSQVEVLLSKIEKVKAETKVRTYTAEVVAAVKTTSEKLDENIEYKMKEISTIKKQLEVYFFLGDEYQSIVKEYTKLQDRINKNNLVKCSMTNQN